MVERTDPARTGVVAGRVVGLLTAVLAVATLLRVQDTYYANMQMVFEILGVVSLFGLDADAAIDVLFWSNVVGAAVVRYSVCYVVGSLVGVVYDWFDRPSLAALTGLVVVVGVVDGVLAGIDARSAVVGVAYLLAWLCYVPVFVRSHDPETGDERSGPRRLGDR